MITKAIKNKTLIAINLKGPLVKITSSQENFLDSDTLLTNSVVFVSALFLCIGFVYMQQCKWNDPIIVMWHDSMSYAD